MNEFQRKLFNQNVDEIVSELSLKDKVEIANLDIEKVELLHQVFITYVRNKVEDDQFEDEDETNIMKELWERLRETHQLRLIKK